MDSDKRLILLSALQHYAFCPRQCALIHNEQAWAENYLTAQGKLLHERVDGGEPETRQGTRFERSVRVLSNTLGISGVLDMVEVSKNGDMHPVEYKHGKPKPTDMDKIQLCSQAMCLEEMTGRTVEVARCGMAKPVIAWRWSLMMNCVQKRWRPLIVFAPCSKADKRHCRFMTNAVRRVHLWIFVSQKCLGKISRWGMWRGCLGNKD